jgi:CheY-like chemotaxis protein
MELNTTKPRLLLVDADPHGLPILRLGLGNDGLEVLTAASGPAALALLESQAIDVIVSDADIPGGPALELFGRLKLNERSAHLPLILVSRSPSVEEKARAFEQGIEDYLAKPVYPRELTARVRMLMQRSLRRRLESPAGLTTSSGRLADLGVADLLQTIAVNGKAGTIRLCCDDGRDGALYFRAGGVLDAEAGSLLGEEAVYRLLSWSEGSFEVEFKPSRRAGIIEPAVPALLAEGMRRFDAWRELLESMPPLETVFVVDFRALSRHIGALPEPVTALLRLFDGRRTMARVVHDSDLGDLPALTVIHGLLDERFLAPARRELAAADGPSAANAAPIAIVVLPSQKESPAPAGPPPAPPPLAVEAAPPKAVPPPLAVEAAPPKAVEVAPAKAVPPSSPEPTPSPPPAAPTAAAVPPAPLAAPAPESRQAPLPAREPIDDDFGVAAALTASRRRTTLAIGGAAAAVILAIGVLMRTSGKHPEAHPAPPAPAAPVAAAPAPLPAAPAPPAPVGAPPPAQAPAAAIPARPMPAPAVAEKSPASEAALEPIKAACHAADRGGTGKYAAIVSACEKAAAADPSDVAVLVILARAEANRGRDVQAMSWAEKAIALDPGAPEAYLFLGSAHQAAGHNKDARAAYQKYIELAPTGKYAADLRLVLRSL